MIRPSHVRRPRGMVHSGPWHSGLSLSGLLLLALLVGSGTAGAAPKFTEDERTRLEAGEVIITVRDLDGGDVTAARAVGVVDAAPAAVWKHIDDCGSYEEFMPKVKEAEELSRKGSDVTCKLVVGMPFPLSDLWSVTIAKHEAKKGDRYRRKWRATEGSYKLNEGSWVLSPWNGSHERTLLVYTIKVAPKASIPAGIRRAAQQQTLPDVIKAVRLRVKGS